MPPTRRTFVRDTAAAALAFAALRSPLRTFGAESAARRHPILGFSKPFQDAGFEATADLVAEIGWDGIECPVRPRGQVEPEKVADELPRLVDALARRGKVVGMLTTAITSMADPHAEAVLRMAARLGIRRLRLGAWRYDDQRSPQEQLDAIAPRVREIAAACRELGLHAGIQNHSGRNHVGAPVWDIYSLVRDIDPAHLGICFDIGHATIEGGLSWPIEARLAAPYYAVVYVKDFTWVRNDQGEWRAAWCRFGDGMVSRRFFDQLKEGTYAGPISQHQEYPLGDRAAMIADMQRDLRVLREWLA